VRAPAQRIPATAPELSLVTAARPAPAGERWEDGLELPTRLCGHVRVFDDCTGEAVPILDLGRSQPVTVDPIVVQSVASCSLMGGRAVLDDLRVEALEELTRLTPYAVERELWTGELADLADLPNRRLASPDAEVLNAVPESPVSVIGRLEEALGSTPGRGLIHAGLRAAAYLAGQTSREGNLLRTKLGSVVVTGAGYLSTGPDGEPAPDGAAWVYATGPVTVRLSTPEIPAQDAETIDRTNNTAEVRAQRLAAVSWDGCAHFAALLALKPN